MALEYANVIVAMGYIYEGDSAFRGPSPGFNPDLSGGLGGGEYELVMDGEFSSPDQLVVIATPRDTTSQNTNIAVRTLITSPTSIIVRTSINGVGVDTVSFDIVVMLRSGG